MFGGAQGGDRADEGISDLISGCFECYLEPQLLQPLDQAVLDLLRITAVEVIGAQFLELRAAIHHVVADGEDGMSYRQGCAFGPASRADAPILGPQVGFLAASRCSSGLGQSALEVLVAE